MADENGLRPDRPAMTDPSNDSTSQARPTSTSNNELGSTSAPSRVFSRSPPPCLQQLPDPKNKSMTLESQPMTTSSSSSSVHQDQQVTNSMDPNGPSPYGTRSRNRTGNARPNYAEDKELEMDFEWNSGKKSHAAGNSAVPGNTISGDSEKPSTSTTRRSSTTAPTTSIVANKATTASPQTNHLPGMSSFSVYPEAGAAPPAPSRKRKAPGNGPVAPHTSSAATQASALNITRRTAPSTNARRLRATNLMTFEHCQGYLKNGKLKADDGTTLAVNDQIYLVCEPPGDPYYLARIMEFLHVDNITSQPVDALRVNWYLRPRDIPRKINDYRMVYATMQTQTCPISSLRGKCRVLHKNDINDLDGYKKDPDSFWYDKMFDRYIHRYYEVVPTNQVINVPANVKKVLDERWKFVVVEVGRGKELTSAIKSCKRCQRYCASNESVDCAVCKDTYHMNCVQPPLLKKPARGFGWSCAPCSRKQEKKLEARNTPLVGEKAMEKEEELIDEEDEHGVDPTNGSSPQHTDMQSSGPRPPTAEQIAQAKLWPYRYLGNHCRVEDALDYDDRIYPRASSRLGPKHQANVQAWHGHSVEYVKPVDIKKKYLKGNSHKKDAKLTKDTISALEAHKTAKEKRPKWVMEEPLGYIPRGGDYPNSDLKNTAELKFSMSQVGDVPLRGGESSSALDTDQREKLVDEYMALARPLAASYGLEKWSTNFLDKALELFTNNGYQADKALQQLQHLNKRKDLKEPIFEGEDARKFEEGVSKFGSELTKVTRHVGKSQKYGEIVRHYYMWKKTDRGKEIWGNYEGHKGKRQTRQADSKFLDEVADDADDSAFDNEKAVAKKRGFECKFCATRTSPQWRRAPAGASAMTVPIDPGSRNSKDKNAHLVLALCHRCAVLWRCLAIQYEDPEEVNKKLAGVGGRAWKRRIDEELLVELTNANIASFVGLSSTVANAAASMGVDVPPSLTLQPGQEGPKKKQKLGSETPAVIGPPNGVLSEIPKKKIIEKPPEPPLIPEPPRVRILPCAVCYEFEPMGDQLLSCRHCRLTVHRNCYGVPDNRSSDKWTCDMCNNDTGHQVSHFYDCVLCSVREYTDKEMMEPPKVSHKKKTDREREKERLEREMVENATENYRRLQRDRGKPEDPRQPLKRTSGNNWVHVVCAVFHYEIKFGDPQRLEPAEGFGAIPVTKYSPTCKLCKKEEGACVNCAQCQASVHPSCAQQHGYYLGFDLHPVKGSRSQAVSTVTINGETGNASALVYCREHGKQERLHPMSELVSDQSPLNALQAFVRSHKQADTSLTGTLRKALIVDSATKNAIQLPNVGSNHRGSTSSAASGGPSAAAPTTRSSRVSPGALTVKSEEVDQDGDRVIHLTDPTPADITSKECATCSTDTSPKWHEILPKIVIDCKVFPVSVAETNGEIHEASSQPLSSGVNGYVNGDSLDSHHTTSLPSTQVDEAPMINGGMGGDGAADTEDEMIQGSEPIVNGGHPETTPTATDQVEEGRKFLCHKCYIRKLKEPTPPRTPTPPPEPVQLEIQTTIPTVSEPQPSSPQVPLVWPSQVAQASPHESYPPVWQPTPPAPPYHGPERLSNGVSHSPPVVVPPPQHYPPPPPHHPGTFTPTFRDSRGVLHRGIPPQHYVPHMVNGQPVEPPSFQYRRNSSGQLVQVPYVPPNLRQPQPPHSMAPIRSPPVRSPSVHSVHERLTQGPHGPPEAAENPFAVPSATLHSPPRQPYGGMYGSPTGNHERPETPPEGFGRDGRWQNENAMANGASASPSLRNLLH